MILPERTAALIAALSFLVLFFTENEKTDKLGLKQTRAETPPFVYRSSLGAFFFSSVFEGLQILFWIQGSTLIDGFVSDVFS